MPDGVDTYRWRGQDLVVTANEGDSREWGSFADAAHVKDLTLCAAEFPHAKALQKNEALGRLNVLTDLGYDAARGCTPSSPPSAGAPSPSTPRTAPASSTPPG